ncbi:hypothetical protein F4780DRAFT_729491 [Xylariomycetidae sp. FL0641]|nr:hypothetical protein F4780DRAFT_729491 [Xylariomycetidae sp. FL0641]
MATPASIDALLPPPTEVNDTHKNYAYGAACIAMGIIGTLCVLARLAIRYRFRNFGADDYAIIPSAILFLAWITMASYLCLNAGVGKPLWEITVHEYSMWLRGQVASIWLYPAVSGSIRVSVSLFFLRIFGKGDQYTRYACWALIALQGAFIVTFSLVPLGICSEFNDEHLTLFTFLEVCSLDYFEAAQTALYTVSFTFDLILLLFPIYPLSKLQMDAKRRTKAIVIFMFSTSASVVAAYKLAVSIQQFVHVIPPDSPFWNYQMAYFVPGQYASYGTTFWIPSVLEPTIAMIGTSLPSFRQWIGSWKSRSKGQSYHFSSTERSNQRERKDARLLTTNLSSQHGDFVVLVERDFELQSYKDGQPVHADTCT